MPRGKPLSEIEKGQIMAYHETGMTNRSIAARISRSHDLINNFLKNPENYGKIDVAALNLSLLQEINVESWRLPQIQPVLVEKSKRIWTWMYLLRQLDAQLIPLE